MSITHRDRVIPYEPRIVKGTSKPEVYRTLLKVANYIEFRAGQAYRGFSPLELRLLLEDPDGPKWPPQVAPKNADARIARMMGFPPGKDGRRAAALMRQEMREFKWAPLRDVVSARMYRSHLHYLWDSHRLVPVGKGRYRLNQVFDAERLAVVRERPSRYLVRPEMWPPVGNPLVVNLREDLVPEEQEVLREMGLLMAFLGDVISRLQGIDKTRFPQAKGKRARKPNELPWGAARHGSMGEYLALIQGTASVISKGWTADEYLPRVQHLAVCLKRARKELPAMGQEHDWLLDEPREEIRPKRRGE